MKLNETPDFLDLLQCTREGDLEKVSSLVENFSVELNCVDKYDYSPLILASLCGHIKIVQYLLQHGAILERDTFDGARCLYGALNDEIRNLLLKYDASTSVDLLQPFAAHLTALRRDNLPLSTFDIKFKSSDSIFQSHKFLLAARSPYFRDHLHNDERWRTKDTVNLPLLDFYFETILKFIYVDNLDAEMSETELRDLIQLTQKLNIPALADYFLDSATISKRERQQLQSRIAQDDLERYVREDVIGQSWTVESTGTAAVNDAKDHLKENFSIAADALLVVAEGDHSRVYPVHRSMLIKSEYYLTAFTSGFAETFEDLPVFSLDTLPEVVEILLLFLYVDKVHIPRHLALEVLETASFLLLTKDRSLKSLAAIAITDDDTALPPGTDVYTILRIAWQTETQRVEQYAAKYIARNFDEYLYKQEFMEIIEESANRISNRQETDTIELVDDIRFYLSQAYGIYLEMNPVDERKPGESVKEDLWVPLTTYEIQYNQQLAKLDDLLASLSLDA
ncbi:BTB/POZ domain-containing protein 3 [Taphrina deformans PYCC 5710]|uniref:BTB/POZ domain-containing protein 3 n=1 Tax=Taphrina deformans (strain PYCC 5710 / ATCC 11124 / CBS 356.35 / IMI 108563 / JCM 9778 / NBRC 8474) TaxID=1097556 RepID=R4XIR2_TAPDE|nr:BTB/POZ domain-containing protein 3 [Taphrina deformans PYCC 5710]|eukprot:CCG83258.1 BTB/POZ domain-containing protein 3 [Taphrina deformans PYCC 5710]